MTADKQDFNKLLEALIDDILCASDEEILAEAQEDGVDPSISVQRLKSICETALISVRKARFLEAKIAFSESRTAPLRPRAEAIQSTSAKERLASVLNQNPDLAERVTLAARNGKAITETDAQSLLEDLEELGLIHKSGQEG